ncbi:fumarate hydratase [Candidatus Methanoplasma termitum]|uniref:Fumarate hydratase n=1 Tax=Candidatus Methanoplasma termitum TaxID=1577791 RepID=A0A0A7LG57_9ARCH|nr:FumA C-terminus/TtdB family hydratase beta subunit [Candidatus Methanoplasma termitum]AIZ57287.1 fumarate hydratase [Candidatus Methanoplasma termitum]MCL2334066.1 FumA C-terminus/TtdB family hydratase beta subunit [Candidatus Methanoplasma sp.]
MELRTPLSENAVRSLRIGETIHLTGDVITGRDEVHIRAMEYLHKKGSIPKEIDNSVLYHCGPIIVNEGKGWKVLAAGPTTSARMNSLEPDMIRKFNIRAIIGKGGMSKEVGDAMREAGCVYLAAVGGTAVSLAEAVKEVRGVEWADLGMAEALWFFRVERMGPLIVAVDSKGNSLYENVRSKLIRGL